MIWPKGRIVAAMSGGVDSSVAAALLLREGFEVIGITLQLQTCGETPQEQSCCGAEGVAQARAAADHLGIPHHVLDCRGVFEQTVLLPSWEEYRRGRTPNPCVLCNREVKFGALLEYAKTLGAHQIATGHYARIGGGKDGRTYILRGADPRKDQSYFLFSVNSDKLSRALFPLGGYTKETVRTMARRMGLGNADRAESQDACFSTRETAYAETLRRRFNQGAAPGPIFDQTGRRLGEHEGIHLFTIGQRRGIGVTLGAPAWVESIDPDRSAVFLTTSKERLAAWGLIATGVSWHALPAGLKRLRCSVQVRYNQAPVAATVEQQEPGTVRVRFDHPVTAVCPGQAAVFYSGPRLLGGGWIHRALSESAPTAGGTEEVVK
ncbi:MAG: tRNA 2-thiouridine(34) synthase MnmA [Syntrophobacteraceae bacterium]|nr:tRNA 2-thiouridine(34) synthase MnmA [Syntrophobacteraceae bacterium]